MQMYGQTSDLDLIAFFVADFSVEISNGNFLCVDGKPSSLKTVNRHRTPHQKIPFGNFQRKGRVLTVNRLL
jgi:hypothetical protein